MSIILWAWIGMIHVVFVVVFILSAIDSQIEWVGSWLFELFVHLWGRLLLCELPVDLSEGARKASYCRICCCLAFMKLKLKLKLKLKPTGGFGLCATDARLL